MSFHTGGVVLERISGKKLSIIVGCLIAIQFTFFLIGAIKFPNATHTETIEGIMCKDENAFKSRSNDAKTSDLYYLRDYLGRSISNCERIPVDEHKNVVLNTHPQEIIYAFQLPLPREDKVLKLHRWFQTMTAVMHLQVLLPETIRGVEKEESRVSHSMKLNVRLAYRDQEDLDQQWYHLANNSDLYKTFNCYKNPYSFDCDMIPLFELGSVHHEFYLINIKLSESNLIDSLKYKESTSSNHYLIKELPEVRLMITFIYQSGGFTKLWLTMKTILLPFLLIITCWYWNRIMKLERPANLLERMIFSVSLAAMILNMPVEYLSLFFDLKWMLMYTDLRQGLFYSTLFTFWIVFCGEHYVDDNSIRARKTFKSYWKYIGPLWVGCLSLLGFELCQRGMQLSDPFFSLWDTSYGSNLAIAMLVIACTSVLLYFGLLIYLVFNVFVNFRSKQSQLPAMSSMRRAFYEGIIYRFKFLLLSTVFCAAMTVTFFIVHNFDDSHWFFDNDTPSLNYTGGLYTGVYGMWNIYAAALMIFYAPSHKNKPSQFDSNENVEFVNLHARLDGDSGAVNSVATARTESLLTAFANKLASS